jgi:hypothetical protein
MKLTSSVFGQGDRIPSKYTCDDKDLNPPLTISEVPDGARSLALIMHDPDVPRNLRKDGLWVHWVVYNIPPDLREIPEGQEPEGVGGIGTNSEVGYMGPCPPDREHRYFFNLYALDTELDLPPRSTKGAVEEAVKGHILDQAELMGRYERI